VAADDICYTIIDFEDGINLGLVSEDFFEILDKDKSIPQNKNA
jgi:hypothetical protein